MPFACVVMRDGVISFLIGPEKQKTPSWRILPWPWMAANSRPDRPRGVRVLPNTTGCLKSSMNWAIRHSTIGKHNSYSYKKRKIQANHSIIMQPIGIIHSPFLNLENMPIQPKGAQDVIGTIEIEEQYSEGLADLEGFSHIYLLYQFHKATHTSLTVTPFMDTHERGVFATRSPLRPSHIGLSIVRLEKVENNLITVRGIDTLDGTPLLDIKPYIAAFDSVHESRSGWMKSSEKEVAGKRSDHRFVK